MQIVTDKEIEMWLMEQWSGDVEWDVNNLHKPRKHGMDAEEVESIFDNEESPIIVAGKIIEPKDSKWGESRYMIFGETFSKKEVALIWTPRADILRPITCRRMRDNERKKYKQKRG